MSLLKIKNICYLEPGDSIFKKKNRKTILSNISFEVIKGEIIAIVGESGAGKSTLAKIIAGILEPDEGVIMKRNAQVINKSRFFFRIVLS